MAGTVVSDTTVTNPDGSTIETIIFSDGSKSIQFTPAAGSPAANVQTLQQQAQTALTNNRTYLAIPTPTTAQVTAQVKALTQQHQALIRLALAQFDATN